ncbi:uncharacterized protein LOC8285747 isoform X3 [Ricinus communis]|uniref:uncharacterized protein LOC8285747 isoform X3 n=1 Tax=Ricinus communis TaxID=3988 RepID=UPI00077260A9|nr:uncharacterized protein LOC8285747 isoform X3 [Ricinus communis]
MDSDWDPFDDVLPEPALAHARAGGKFQPRAKPRPKKVASASISSILPTNAKEKYVPSLPTALDRKQSAQSVDNVDDILTIPASSSPASSTLPGREEHLEKTDENLKCEPLKDLTELVRRSKDLPSADALPLKVVVSDRKTGDSCLSIKKTDSSQLDLDAFAGSICDAAENKALVDSHTTTSVQSVDVLDKTMGPVGPSFPEQIIESNEPLGDSEVLFSDDSNLKLINLSPNELESKEDMISKDDHAEVNEMELDLDPFADILPPPSISSVRNGGKFQPRAKARPRKGTSETVAIAASTSTMEEQASLVSHVSDNLQPAKFVDAGDGRLRDPVPSSLYSLEILVSKESLRNDDYKNFGVLLSSDVMSSGLVNSSQLLSTDAVHLGGATRDLHFGLAKSMGENTDIFSGLEYIHDLVTQSPSSTEIPVHSSNEETEGSRFPAQNSVNSSALGACSVDLPDPVSCNEAAIWTDNRRPEVEGFFLIWEGLIIYLSPFLPRQKVQTGKEKSTVSTLPQDAVDSVASSSNAEFEPSETMYMDVGSIPTFPSDDVLDYSSMSFSNCISPDATTSGFLLNEEQINLAEASRSSDPNVLCQEDLPVEAVKENSKSRRRKSSSLLISSQKFGEASLAGEMGGSGKSSRQLRKRTAAPQLVDEPEDEACDNDGFPSKASSNSIADEEDGDYDYRVDEDNDNEDALENKSRKKRASEKLKKPAADEGKTVRRRKRDTDASEQLTQQPRKKFSHSTRRKNRLKDLLSMPEDEIDFQRLPVRDIILLAGYRESLASKEAKESKNASTNQSTANSFHGEDSHNEEDTVTSEQSGGHINDQSNILFNYHSFMDKTPTARWSKQETELFYEGIQQFGTDLSMIQQLFPGRTRHQIKLKYKKEERQHPLRLSDALRNRAKDHSHFEKVIEQLQQVATQAEQECNRDASVDVTDEEAELNPETNQETTKSERYEDVTVEDREGDVNEEVHSPSKYDEDDDDLDIWSSYKSVF